MKKLLTVAALTALAFATAAQAQDSSYPPAYGGEVRHQAGQHVFFQ
ncbi:hypothetical protein ACU4GH_40600 (plasmid) [Bradyrhizobium betae]